MNSISSEWNRNRKICIRLPWDSNGKKQHATGPTTEQNKSLTNAKIIFHCLLSESVQTESRFAVQFKRPITIADVVVIWFVKRTKLLTWANKNACTNMYAWPGYSHRKCLPLTFIFTIVGQTDRQPCTVVSKIWNRKIY